MSSRHSDGTRCLEGRRGAPTLFRACCDLFEAHLSACAFDVRYEWRSSARQWVIAISESAGGGGIHIRYCPHCGAELRPGSAKGSRQLDKPLQRTSPRKPYGMVEEKRDLVD